MTTSTPTQNIGSRFFTPPQYFAPFGGLNVKIIMVLLLFLATNLAHAQTWQTVVDINRTSFNQSPTNSVYTVPAGGPFRYRITVKGGNGGGSNPSGNETPTQGGRGGVFSSEYNLPTGWTLDCVAGSNGKSSYPTSKYGAGGGGASGVYLYSPLGNGPLIVAGGGGGAGGGSTPIFITSFQYHGGGDAIGYASAGSGGGGGAGFTNAHPSPNDWAGGGGGGVSGNGGDNNLGKSGKLYAAGGGMGGNSNLHPSFTSLSSPGGGGFVGGGGASVLYASAGGGGGGYTGGGGGGNSFNTSTPIGYEGSGGTSFNSTLGYNTSAFSLTTYASLGGSVKVEVLVRLSDFGTVIPNAIPDDLVPEFNQLEALYRATNGANWTNKTNWLTGGDMASWAGVTLTADGKSVLKIELPSNNLVGTSLPDLNLPDLQTLNLGNNTISGAIPNFNYLPKVEVLKLNTNQFSGSIPNLSACTSLSELNLAINQLTGSLPNFSQEYITHIDVGLNQLTGNLPALNKQYLRFLSVYGNKMSGQIPNLTLPALTGLNIAFNNFSGTLPPVLNGSGIGFAVASTWVNDNNYNFGSLLNSLLLNGTIVYAPQKKIGISYTNGALEVNTGVPSGSTTQTFYWYKDNAVVAVNNNNLYRPTATGTYRVEVAHSTLTVGAGDKNLILISDNVTVSSVLKSNAGRTLPTDLPSCLVDDFNELEKIYDATGGANWTTKTNWLTSGNIAAWHGVWGMSADGCNVADLVLNSNNLVGTMPNLNLPSATRLSFADNQISGSFPSITAPNLKILGFSSNQLSGNIPNFNFTLDEFYINNNRFIYGDMEGKTWLNTPVLYYKDQANIPTTQLNCALTVNTGSTATDQIFIWFRRNANGSLTEVTRGNSPQFTPSVLGTYLCHAYHSTLSRADIPARNIVLVSDDMTISDKLYVKPTASGNGSGDSWANAMGSLQDALNNIQCGGEIWVATGTYKPSRNVAGTVVNDATRTFAVKNVRLYGGFAGTETSLAQRISGARSVLSGDFSNNDGISGSGNTLSLTNNGENAYHVVSINTPSVSTVINGFDIVGGNANGATGNYLGATGGNDKGGGVFINGGSANVTIDNCVFTGNAASSGGAMANIAASPTIRNCFFDRNRTALHGAALFNNNGASPTITNCVINGNWASGVGGAMYNLLNAAVTCTNTTFNGNASSAAGVIYNDGSTTTLLNGIIWNSAGTILDAFNGGSTTATYSTIEGATVFAGTGNANTNPNFRNIGNPKGADNIWGTSDDGLQLTCGSPAFNSGSNAGPTTDILGNSRPQLTTTDRGAYEATTNLTIQTASIVVTAGCGSATLLASATPILGGETYAWSGGTTPSVSSNTVTSNGTYTVTVTSSAGCTATANTTVTLTTPASRVFVNAATTNTTKNGLSWATAFDNLQAALSACKTSGAEIWVAKGTYKPSADVTGNANPSNLRTRTFFVQGNVNIYGGFAGTETALSQRTPSLIVANPTILSGDFNGDDTQSGNGSGLTINNLTDNAYHVVSFSGAPSVASRLDGFQIRGGNANFGADYNDYGGGVVAISVGDKLTVANCVFQFNGGYYGGGMANISGASPTVQNCVFDRNFALAHGGAVTNYVNSAPSFNNCVMTGNNALNVAGGVYNRGNCNATFNNTTLVGNAAVWVESGVIYNDASYPTLTNSILWANAPNAFGTWAGGAPTVNYSIVQGGHAGTSNTNSDPVFTNISNPIGADNQWFTSDDGLRLACGSPAFNTGTTTTLTTDIVGTSRPQLSTNDRGAYESTANLFTLAPTANAAQSFCGSPTIANLVVTGTAVKWYAAATGGTQLSNTTALTNGSIYYASQTLNDCESVRTAVTATVNALPTVQITGATAACGSVNLTISGGSTYAWSGGATPSVASNTFTTSGTYTVTVTTAQGCSATANQVITVYKSTDANLVLSNRTALNVNNTNCTTDDYFTANITVNYTQKPTSGTLSLTGSDIVGTPPAAVNVAAIGANAYTFTGVKLRPDGLAIELSATFSDCYTVTNTNLGTTDAAGTTPNTITVGGLSVCTSETGVYTLAGMANGALEWRKGVNGLYWTGTRWELIGSNLVTLSFSTAGSVKQFPCAGWNNNFGCGTPTFDFCGNLGTTSAPTVGSISLANASACQSGTTCSNANYFTADVTVNFAFAPATGNLTLKQGTTVLATKAANELSCVTSWTFNAVQMPTNNAPIVLTAEFSAAATFTSSSLGNAPAPCFAGQITALTAANISACNDKNTTCQTDDAYTAAITVSFYDIPNTGVLALSGDDIIGTPPSVSVANLTGNTYTFTNVTLRSDGAAITLTAAFSSGCSLTNNNLGTAPSACSSAAATVNSISLANASACQLGTTCSNANYFTADVTVNFAFAPATGNLTLKQGTTVLATKAAAELNCVTSWTFNAVQMLANGAPIVLTAEFSAAATFTSSSLGNAPAPCFAGQIIAIAAANVSACNPRNTICHTDDSYTADITITFNGIPNTGTLALSGEDIIGTPPSVSVANLTGNSYTFTGVTLRSDGQALGLTATISGTCSLTNTNLANAPTSCSGGVPSVIKVGGFTICPAETGNYNYVGIINNAPYWESTTDKLYWTGTRWEINLKSNGTILSFSNAGSIANLPCTGWNNNYGCGIPTFSFCGNLNATSTSTINSISLANTSPCQTGATCTDRDYFTTDVTVHFAFAPTTGNLTLKQGTTILATKAASELSCVSAWTFNAIQLTANGLPIVLTAEFSDAAFTSPSLGNAPAACRAGKITALTATNISACNGKNTTCSTDDSYTADITVTFVAAPTTGTLALSGADLVGTPPSVSAANLTGNTYIFTNVAFRSNGATIALTASFSNDCSLTDNNLGNAPQFCSGGIPNTITVGGFAVCPAETGNYTLVGTRNGAPSWESVSDRLYWTGARWEIILKSNGGILSFSNNGLANNFPCTGWTNSYGCGIPTFDYCGLATAIDSISVANTSACQEGATCSEADYFTADVTVTFAFAPSTGNLTLKQGTTVVATKAASELSCVTAWTFNAIRLTANGLPIVLTADFNGAATFTSPSLGNAPAACSLGKILAVAAANVSACNGKNTTCPTDDSYTADITLSFARIPTTGTLALTGEDLIGTPPSVSVANLTGNTYTFTNVNLRSDGAALALTASFSNGCSLTNSNLVTAPTACSSPSATVNSISLANASACQGACGVNTFTASVTVNFTYAPTTGDLTLKQGTTVLATKSASELSCVTTWTFNTISLIANGLPIELTAEFDNAATLTNTNLGNAPAACSARDITAITATNMSACNGKNTTCATDDSYTADITVTFGSIPTTGTLGLSGDDLIGTPPSVSVANLMGTTYTFTNVTLRTDGNPLVLTATFSNGCSFTNNNLATAPPSCSNPIPSVITVSNMDGCSYHEGGYTLRGFINGAPSWRLDAFHLFWTGSFWQFKHIVGQNVLANNYSGSPTNLPCSNWEYTYNCGAPAFNFCGFVGGVTPAINSISLANTSACQTGATCTDRDYFTADVTVHFAYAPSAGNLTLKQGTTVLATKDASELSCVSAWTFNAIQLTANGLPIVLTADFNNVVTFNSQNLGNAPAACSVGKITALTAANVSACNSTNTTCSTDDSYTADITVTFGTIPTTGTLALSGDDLVGTPPSVSVANLTGNSYIFTGVNLRSDGNTLGLTATFSNGCLFNNDNLATAPLACSNGVIPNVITVGGFTICPAETGNYTLVGTRNGAPSWESASDRLYWTGARWEIILKSNGAILSFSTAGSILQFPCTNWNNNYGCGAPTFNFCGFLGTNPRAINGISLINTSACQAGTACNDPDYFTTDVKVNFAFAPTTGNLTLKQGATVLATKTASELACVDSWIFTGISLAANGLSPVLTAEFNNAVTFTASNLSNAPFPCSVGSISTISAANLSACKNLNTPCTTDDHYTADVTVNFGTIPANGTLALSGDDVFGTPPSVLVTNLTGNSYTFTGVKLRSDGNPLVLTAAFSNGCSLTNNNLGNAPNACGGVLPSIIKVTGFPTCPAETGDYAVAGTLNGAPYWQSASSRVYWTGASWHLIFRLNGAVFSFSNAGSATQFPCTGWNDNLGCGTPIFDFCGFVGVAFSSVNSISLANPSACQMGATCADNDLFTADITVNFAHAPTSGNLTLKQGTTVLATKAASELSCVSSWTFPAISLASNGLPLVLTAEFSNTVTYTSSNLGNAPVACRAGKITAIGAANLSACLGRNTTCITDDSYTADITVHFGVIPTTGTLALSGDDLIGTPPSVSVANLTGTTYTFTGVNLRADGNALVLTAAFSNGCSFSNNNLATAPISCSSGTPNVITVGGFAICPAETGNYTVAATLNGAPSWESASDRLYWTGTRWEIILKSNGGILSFSTNGAANNFPCTGWNNWYGCGVPTFDFCGLLGTITATVNSISLSNTSACQAGTTCADPDYFTTDVKVNFSFAPTRGNLTLKQGTTVLATKSTSELSCVTSWTFNAIRLTANGLPIVLTADFNNAETFTSPSLGNAPTACGCLGLTVSTKVLLEGPYNTTSGLMNDGLRSGNLLPTGEPYAGLTNFTHVGGGGGETTTANVLSVTGANAIVDWIFLELRHPSVSNTVLYTRSALLQADGDIVDVDGVSPVSFPNAPKGSYYIGVRHRNHLGIVSVAAMDLTAVFPIDFKDKTTNVSTSKMNELNNLKVMRGGDVNNNGLISALDIAPVRTMNVSSAAAYTVEDVNMNGIVTTLDISIVRKNNKSN